MNKTRYRELERMMKGVANHRRVQGLDLIAQKPELSVMEIARDLNVNFKTIAEHVRRMAIAGLLMKRNDENAVRHKLTPRGMSILKFLRTLE